MENEAMLRYCFLVFLCLLTVYVGVKAAKEECVWLGVLCSVFLLFVTILIALLIVLPVLPFSVPYIPK